MLMTEKKESKISFYSTCCGWKHWWFIKGRLGKRRSFKVAGRQRRSIYMHWQLNYIKPASAGHTSSSSSRKRYIFLVSLLNMKPVQVLFVWSAQNGFLNLFDTIISEEVVCSPVLPQTPSRSIHHISQCKLSLVMFLCKQGETGLRWFQWTFYC